MSSQRQEDEALLRAAEMGNVVETTRLLSEGANVEGANVEGTSPTVLGTAHWHAQEGQHRLVITNDDFQKFLVTNNPDVGVLDQWLTGYGGARLDQVSGRWILGPGFPMADWPQLGHPEATGNNPFWLVAPKLGFAQITKHMVSHYQCNLEAQTKKGETALHLAAYFGHAKVVKTLLDLGADSAHVNKRGETALTSAKEALGQFNRGQFVFPNLGSTRFDFRKYDGKWPRWTGEEGVIQLLEDVAKRAKNYQR